MPRTFRFCFAAILAFSFTLTACDSSEDEEGEDTDFAVGCDDPDAITIQVPPGATYLRTAPSDEVEPAPASELATLGLEPGDVLRMERLGEYQFRDIHPDSARHRIVAVFSSNDTLLDPTERARVPGAIEAGNDFVTRDSHRDGGETDIPEDFAVLDVETVTVPQDAEYLFVSPEDDLFEDNLDEDDDFRLCITLGG